MVSHASDRFEGLPGLRMIEKAFNNAFAACIVIASDARLFNRRHGPRSAPSAHHRLPMQLGRDPMFSGASGEGSCR